MDKNKILRIKPGIISAYKMLSEKGSLKEISVIKLLLALFEQALTGVLYFSNEGVQKVL